MGNRSVAVVFALVGALGLAACAGGDDPGVRCDAPRGSRGGVWAEEGLRPELAELWRAGVHLGPALGPTRAARPGRVYRSVGSAGRDV